MPIELWWWVVPLFLTGWLTLLTFGIAAILIDAAYPDSICSYLFAIIACLPWVICAATVVVWLIVNILILIWR